MKITHFVLTVIFFLLLVLAGKKELLATELKFRNAFDIGGEASFAIIQDREGFLWFGSVLDGLVRFDGTNVRKFRAGPNSIAGNSVFQLFEDSDGEIWIGTNVGLSRYNKLMNSFGR